MMMRTWSRLRRHAWGLALGILAQGLSGLHPADAADLKIYFVDVMGGAATLVVTPERETVLVDSGWPGQGDRDPLRILEALKDAGCDRIDHLVTTHWHMDHFGGVAGLAKRVPIGRFWDRGLPEDGGDQSLEHASSSRT